MSATPATQEPMAEALRRIQEDQNRADLLEFLYVLDERDSDEHPFHHSYTGLFQDYAYLIGMAILEAVSKGWHLHETHETMDRIMGIGPDDECKP